MRNIHVALLVMFLMVSCKPNKTANNTTQVDNNSMAVDGPVKSIKLIKQWSSDSTSLITPESVMFDEMNGIYYVSCIGGVPPTKKDRDGYIAVLDQRGKVVAQNWLVGLNAPKGMGMKDGKLYVTDIDELVIVDISTASVVDRVGVPGATFLNDVAIAPNGIVYFTDSNENTVYTYSNEKVSLYKKDKGLGGTNGILVDDETIYLAGFGNGDVNTISIDSKDVTNRGKGIVPGGDGIEAWEGGHIISNWNGEIYFSDASWNTSKIIDTKEMKVNAADIDINYKTGELLVPTFFDNRVVCYKIENLR